MAEGCSVFRAPSNICRGGGAGLFFTLACLDSPPLRSPARGRWPLGHIHGSDPNPSSVFSERLWEGLSGYSGADESFTDLGRRRAKRAKKTETPARRLLQGSAKDIGVGQRRHGTVRAASMDYAPDPFTGPWSADIPIGPSGRRIGLPSGGLRDGATGRAGRS
jgi:hypothetical protein